MGVGMGLAIIVLLLLAEEMVVVMVDGSSAREGALEMA
jgi:ribosomal protein S25